MRRPAIDRAGGGDQRLPDHLPAEHALPAHLRTAAPKQVDLERFEVEHGQQVLDGRRHGAVIYCGHGEDKAIEQPR